MRATDFEYRHQGLLHQLLVAAAFLTYLVEPDDIVWSFIKNSAAPRALERSLFAIATMLIAVGAGLCIKARAYGWAERGVEQQGRLRTLRHAGEVIYVVGFGSLAPRAGFVILVAGECSRIRRLMQRAQSEARWGAVGMPPPATGLRWRMALRREAAKFGVLLSVIVFVITLQDRVVEVLVVLSLLVGLLLNAPGVRRGQHEAPSG